MKSRLIVTTIIEKEGKILLGRKSKNVGPYPNTWHLLGGGVNLEKEALIDAVKREIREEAGLDATNIESVGFDEDYEPDKHGEMTHYVFLSFRVAVSSDTFVAADDITELQWFEKTALKTLSLPCPTTKLFTRLGLL